MMTRKTQLSILWAAVVSLSAGCAADTTEIRPAFVSQAAYQGYTCDQIAEELGRVSRKAEDVGAVVDKMAKDDNAQMAIGLILFWPALFLLEGKDTPQTREYARLMGELEALEDAAVKNGCRVSVRHVAQGAGAAAAPGKLAALKLRYRDADISEQAYLAERRKLMDQPSAPKKPVKEHVLDAEAQFRRGLQYYQGDGVARDYAAAALWYRKSAGRGYGDAQNSLSLLYDKGRGVAQDFVQAHMWLNLAAAKGNATASKNRDAVTGKMTPAQIAEAQRLAREWRPK